PASLVSALQDGAGTDLMEEWWPAVAGVRPRLASVERLVDAGLLRTASQDPDDPWRTAQLVPDVDPETGLLVDGPDPRLAVAVGPRGAAGWAGEWQVLDSFSEGVPSPVQTLGLAFDAATPSAAPPQAVLLVPTLDPAVPLAADDLPAVVLRARDVAHARMADTAALAAKGLGPLAAACVLPQDADTGCPLEVTPSEALPKFDRPAALVARTAPEDMDDVIAAVTADPAWMVGVQWRLGEHAGEDAATPVQVETAHVEVPL